MALTVNIVDQEKIGHSVRVYGSFTLAGSYTAGGFAVNWRSVQSGNRTPRIVHAYGKAGYIYEYDKANAKLIIRGQGSGKVLQSYAPGGGDIKGSVNTDSENADAAALPVNGDLVDTLHAVALGGWSYSEDAEPDVARNVVISIFNDSGSAKNLFEGVTSFAVTGFFRGVAQIDTITFTSSAGNKSVANTKYRYKYGVKPFDVITNVVMANAPDDDLKIGVGIGSKLGLPADLYTPAEADVIKITKNGANLSPSGIVSTTNMTVNLGTLADGADVAIQYNSAAGPAAEIPATTVPTAVSSDVVTFEAVFPAA